MTELQQKPEQKPHHSGRYYKPVKREGKTIEPGQKIRYIIHDHFRKKSKRVIPMEIITPDDSYDAKRYSELLDKCCKSVVEQFE